MFVLLLGILGAVVYCDCKLPIDFYRFHIIENYFDNVRTQNITRLRLVRTVVAHVSDFRFEISCRSSLSFMFSFPLLTFLSSMFDDKN